MFNDYIKIWKLAISKKPEDRMLSMVEFLVIFVPVSMLLAFIIMLSIKLLANTQ